jgi:H+/gluconate symporter-like permease
VTSSPAVTQAPIRPTIRPTIKPTQAPTPASFSMPQAQATAAALGIPALANVFYYGKEFGSKKQKLNEKGQLVDEDYKSLSVTKPGAEGELMEDIAEEKKNKENSANDALDLILGKSSDSMSLDDILNIVKGT